MMEGEVTAIDLLARLVELGRERFTGAIRFENDGIIKILYFKGGDLLSASTNDRSDSVDELLLRAGKVTREHVKQALAQRKENESLGDALLNLGFITRKELTWGRRVQVISVIRSIRTWKAGTYTIVADYLPKREEGTLFSLQQIIVELIVTEQDRSQFERALEGGSAVFVKVADFDAHYRNLGLNEDADAVAKEIDGKRAASEIASFAGRDTFNVFKLLNAFAILGLIERVGKPQPALQFASGGSEDLLSTSAVADADDVWKPTAPGTMPVPPARPTPPPKEELGDAPTLEIPLMSMPPDPPARPRTEARSLPAAPAPRRPTQTQARNARPVLTAPGSKKRANRAPFVLVLLLLLIGAGGYAGWKWWQERQPPQPRTTATTTGLQARGAAAAPSPAPKMPVTTTAPKTSAPTAAFTTTAPATATVARMPVVPPPPTTTGRTAEARTTPAPPKPPPKPATTDRYVEMARQFERTANGAYTVQFELVCQTASLAKAMEAGGQKIWFIPTTYRGQSCYRVFWGRYPTREAAALAAGSIPQALRGAAPAVVRIP